MSATALVHPPKTSVGTRPLSHSQAAQSAKPRTVFDRSFCRAARSRAAAEVTAASARAAFEAGTAAAEAAGGEQAEVVLETVSCATVLGEG
eukprot:SAG11_NODE_4328_length_1946_cov_2.121819_3_plen_91_part_00